MFLGFWIMGVVQGGRGGGGVGWGGEVWVGL